LLQAVAGLLAEGGALAAMREACGRFSASHRGATERTLALIEQWQDPGARWPGPDRPRPEPPRQP
jgi:hypothetical protein